MPAQDSDNAEGPDTGSADRNHGTDAASGRRTPEYRARVLFVAALCLLYLVAVVPRLRVAGFDEPDLTYGDELMTIGQAETLLTDPDGKILHFHKFPGAPHFLYITFFPYYHAMRSSFGWETIQDVQFWRVRRYWRTLNILLSGLIVVIAAAVGKGAFNRRVGLLAGSFLAVSSMCAVWFSFMKEDGMMTLSSAVVVYAAYRILLHDGLKLRWLLLGGFATGTALVFKHNSAPAAIFFIFAILATPTIRTGRGRTVRWMQRFHFPHILAYSLATVLTFLVWFPQLVTRSDDVWESLTSQPQTAALNLREQKLPSVREFFSVAWDTWDRSFHVRGGLSDTYPFYFFLVMTGILIAAPFYALLRRNRFVLGLSVYVGIMYLLVCYQWLFSGWKFTHYFLPAIVPIYLLVAFGLDRICETVTRWIGRLFSVNQTVLQSLMLLAVCAWPLAHSYSESLRTLAGIRGSDDARRLRRRVVHNVPIGSKIIMPRYWLSPQLSDSLFDQTTVYARMWGKYTLDQVVREGFDFACLEDPRVHNARLKEPPFRLALDAKKVAPVYTIPLTSHFLLRFAFVPIQPQEGDSFNLSLYLRNPSAGDFGGVRGIVPAWGQGGSESTTRTLILKARLSNPQYSRYDQYIRWEVLADGQVVWPPDRSQDSPVRPSFAKGSATAPSRPDKSLSEPPTPRGIEDSAGRANLAVTTGSVTPSRGQGNSPVRISLQVRNSGDIAARPTWTHVYLSADESYSKDDRLWISGIHVPALGPGELYDYTTSTMIPALPPGRYSVIVQSDVIDEVSEHTEKDNILSVGGLTVLHPGKYAFLQLRISARPGSRVLIRTTRTDHNPAGTWGWGGRPSQLKIDGLQLIDAETSKPMPIEWTYVGLNGGPGPARYAARRDWYRNPSPAPLLDPGFDGEHPLVHAWRPSRSIEPTGYKEFPKQWICRREARIEKAPGIGPDGSDALRFVVGYPPKESSELSIMQPIVAPVSREVRGIRIHYRPDADAVGRGRAELRLRATAVSLSGEYIDRAEVRAPVVRGANRWKTLELDLEKIWKRKHTRIDLIEFLEVVIEIVGGPEAVYNCLIDNVELE